MPGTTVPAFNASLRGGFSGLHVAANQAQFKELSPIRNTPLKTPAYSSTLDDDILCIQANKQAEVRHFCRLCHVCRQIAVLNLVFAMPGDASGSG